MRPTLDKDAVYEILGFGKPPEETPFAATPGVFTFGWGPALDLPLVTGAGLVRSVPGPSPDSRLF
jgi:hypothetical protein